MGNKLWLLPMHCLRALLYTSVVGGVVGDTIAMAIRAPEIWISEGILGSEPFRRNTRILLAKEHFSGPGISGGVAGIDLWVLPTRTIQET